MLILWRNLAKPASWTQGVKQDRRGWGNKFEPAKIIKNRLFRHTKKCFLKNTLFLSNSILSINWQCQTILVQKIDWHKRRRELFLSAGNGQVGLVIFLRLDGPEQRGQILLLGPAEWVLGRGFTDHLSMELFIYKIRENQRDRERETETEREPIVHPIEGSRVDYFNLILIWIQLLFVLSTFLYIIIKPFSLVPIVSHSVTASSSRNGDFQK